MDLAPRHAACTPTRVEIAAANTSPGLPYGRRAVFDDGPPRINFAHYLGAPHDPAARDAAPAPRDGSVSAPWPVASQEVDAADPFAPLDRCTGRAKLSTSFHGHAPKPRPTTTYETRERLEVPGPTGRMIDLII